MLSRINMKKIFFAILLIASCRNESVKNITGTYAGKYTCADCSGIDVQLQINNDSSFWLYEKYLFGKKSIPFLDSGKWKLNTDKIILSGTTPTPHQYKIINDSVLEMLDGDGKEIESKHSNQITSINKKKFLKPPIGDTITGIYTYIDKQDFFEDCNTRNKVKVADAGIYSDLQKAPIHQKTFVQLVGYYSLQKVKEKASVERVFVPNQLLQASTKDSCR